MSKLEWKSLLDPDLILKYLFLFGMAMMMAAMPLSEYFMSFSQFWLVGVFLLDGLDRDDIARFFSRQNKAVIALLFIPAMVKWILVSLYRKFSRFFTLQNAPALAFSSIYLLHLIGLAYTQDFDYAIRDLRIKFPIFLIPLVLSTTGSINRPQFRALTGFLIGGILIGTLVSAFVFLKGDYTDIRDTSVFISHIRFALLICLGVFSLAWFILKEEDIHRGWKWIMALLLIWMIAYLLMVTSMTGLVTLLITTCIVLFILAFRHTRKAVRWGLLGFLVVALLIILLFIRSVTLDVYRIEPGQKTNLDNVTALGNPYWHEPEDRITENGYYMWLYINEPELREAWAGRSKLSYDGKDLKNQDVKYTLIRFLTSKGYRKDAEGVKKLSPQEVKWIEEGVASIVYRTHPAIYVRVYKIIWEFQIYRLTGNASGHSVMQRYEYFKTSLAIIGQHWLYGVGTGNLDIAFKEQYQNMGTSLDKRFQLRSHNQFLAFSIAFGLIGLAWFLFSLVWPPARLRKFRDYHYLVFFIVIVLSMFTEDTLETQAGVTIYAFFSSFLLFLKKFEDPT